MAQPQNQVLTGHQAATQDLPLDGTAALKALATILWTAGPARPAREPAMSPTCHDLWVYQEIIHETQPDLIVECGTYQGGSAAFLAAMLDLAGKGSVLSIDCTEFPRPQAHPQIRYLTGSSVDPTILAEVDRAARMSSSTLVILDSDHSYPHVLQELRCYHPFVTLDNYLIVEDSNINGNPVLPDFGPGPAEGIFIFSAAI